MFDSWATQRSINFSVYGSGPVCLSPRTQTLRLQHIRLTPGVQRSDFVFALGLEPQVVRKVG